MSKNALLDRPGQSTTSRSMQKMSEPWATQNMQQVIEQEKSRRVSRSRDLEIQEYQPYAQDSALYLMQHWHLLFFARKDTMHIHDLRLSLQQTNGRDVQLMQYVKSVQAQYRQHMAQTAQALSESIVTQPVIAEICYGGLSIAPGFWLPEDMQMGLSLLPATGARLALDGLTLVEHCLQDTILSMDALMVVAAPRRTKAELAALLSVPGDGSGLEMEKQIFTFSTPCITFAFLATASAAATIDVATQNNSGPGGGDDYYTATGTFSGATPGLPIEDGVSQQGERVRGLGHAPSASQLLEVRQQWLTGEMNKTR